MKDFLPKPCPFCKNDALLLKQKRSGQTVFHYIYCQKCGTSGPHALSELSAISWWNIGSKKLKVKMYV